MSNSVVAGGADEGLGGTFGGLEVKVFLGGDRKVLSPGRLGVEGEGWKGATIWTSIAAGRLTAFFGIGAFIVASGGFWFGLSLYISSFVWLSDIVSLTTTAYMITRQLRRIGKRGGLESARDNSDSTWT